LVNLPHISFVKILSGFNPFNSILTYKESFFKANYTFPKSVYNALLSFEFESEDSIKTNSIVGKTKGET
jgi:hypothetical protein